MPTSSAEPVEPAPSRYAFSLDGLPAGEEMVGLGADLAPGTLLAAYRSGVFPMPVSRRGPMGWWSPDPRGVLGLDDLKVSRSLRVACRRFEIRVDTAYDEVVRACADPRRPGGWIRRDVREAYARLHDLGWVHSVEAWSVERDTRGEVVAERLAGGLYGVAVGGLFAGESMFHRERDASKAALVALVDMLRAARDADRVRDPAAPARLLDVQWATDHLVSLGATEMPRPRYLAALRDALTLPTPALRARSA
ncbi:MAG: leucyl/phenylalanyl-tRNA--protein transferase [Actinomycetes bacterium]